MQHQFNQRQDFYNLVDVYLDAVLHPKCVADAQTFAQEGWHLEMDAKDADLTFKGVVFNEMKGVYSSPDSSFYRVVQRALFPDNTYRHDSGGDPAAIPDLTFEAFQARACRGRDRGRGQALAQVASASLQNINGPGNSACF